MPSNQLLASQLLQLCCGSQQPLLDDLCRRGAKATAEVNMKEASTSEDESAGDTS